MKFELEKVQVFFVLLLTIDTLNKQLVHNSTPVGFVDNKALRFYLSLYHSYGSFTSASLQMSHVSLSNIKAFVGVYFDGTISNQHQSPSTPIASH